MQSSGQLHDRRISLRQAYVELVLCVCFWGASFASMKIAVRETSPFLAVWFRIAFGMLVLTPAVFRRGEFRLPNRSELLPLACLGAQGVVFHQNIQFIAMGSAGVANANWIIAATPSLIALLGWLLLRERISLSAVAGLLVSGLGVLLVVGLGTKGLGTFRAGSLGDALIAVSALNWALFQILSRKLVLSAPATFTVFWMNLLALLLQTALLLAFPPDYAQLRAVSPMGWRAMLFLGAICSGLCYIFWYDGLSVMPTAKVAAFQFLQPVVGVFAAYFMIGERFTPFIYVGSTMIVIGVWMVNKRRKTKCPTAESPHSTSTP